MWSFFSLEHLFLFLCWLLAAGWLWQGIAGLRGMPGLPDLTGGAAEGLQPLAPCEEPDLTVIVPACNEEKTIAATLRSLLASTGLRLQIIAVNDRSVDLTGKSMLAVAEEAESTGSPHTLEVLTIGQLPAGWLGKPHAMARAAARAKAAWLLFTDGDVLFEPKALELALRWAQSTQADHLILVPSLILRTTSERAMLGAMQALAQWTVRIWKVADPRARDFLGVGGFNLVRRSAYDAVGGFEALRLEVLDDLRLGWKIKRAGFAQQVALGPGLVRIRWIDGAFGVVHLVEKNGFALYRYRVGLHLLASLAMLVQFLLPLAGIAAGGWTMVAGLVTYLGIGMVYRANGRMSAVGAWHAILFAPMGMVISYGFLRSMVLALVRNGVDWRGTRYPLGELRRHAGLGW
ncbi:MAG TPA: glycosyltransferase family 2 protein [Terracidiphilus sp.]|nr:glycosyltransferase family 2 protein [Terracidiphilus sp.]